MELAKAMIEPEGGERIKVLFNPNNYRLDKTNQVAEIGIPGLEAPVLQYIRGNCRTLAMDLFFDTFEEQADVREHTRKIYSLLSIDRGTHVPPICKFVWGDFQFRCVLDRIAGRFTLFLPDGKPVRATLSVVFKEFIDIDQMVSVNPTQSSDHEKLRTIRWGDTLSSIAAEEYDDPAQWRVIAAANGIDNPRELRPGFIDHPRELRPGFTIVIPAIT